ncbi:MAG TPA: DNA primase [Dictyobacter sp.]|nr:DNA primase [Dictyobacter sp.]
MASTIEAIKAKLDIADEISSVVALQKSGKALKGLCPFHNERTPSFYVYRESQSWHCFGCNEGGDIFSFVEKQQNLDFHEALLYLAEKADVPVEEYSSGSTEDARETSVAREHLRKMNEDAMLWFHQMLLRSKDAEDAREYVKSRGISADSVITFGLGYASDQWDRLSRYLVGQGYTEQEIVDGGLARWRENNTLGGERRGGIYDYFRNRLIFPIRDTRGHVIAFGGRALGDSKPKYLNSPQTLLFEKSSVLYALDMARDAIKQVGQVIIVEGYVDALIAHQYGTRQTVACIGSAITEKHIQQLKKLTKQVTLALDPDAAGNAATEQGIEEALKGFDRTVVPVPIGGTVSSGRAQGKRGNRQRVQQPIVRLEEQVDAEINVLQLPEGEDPDEVIQRDFSSWLYAVAHPLPLIDYFFVAKTADLNLREPMGKAEAARRLLPIIAMVSDRIKRDAYMRKLATKIHIDERSLRDELQKVLSRHKMSGVNVDFSGKTNARQLEQRKESEVRKEAGTAEVAASQSIQLEIGEGKNEKSQSIAELDSTERSRLKWEDYLIGLLLQNPDLRPHVCGIIDEGDFAGTDTRELYHILNSIYQRDSSPSHQSFEQFVPSALLPTVARGLQYVESRSFENGEMLVKEAVQCATRLKRMRLLQLNTEIKFLLDQATESGDKTATRHFQLQILDISRQLRTINTATHLQG